jgi:DNA-binding NtrC family response regulator
MSQVLIIDDESTIRRILDRMLRERGHTTEQAESGEAGLLAARAHRPDLILLDVNMGGMDGLETLALLCRAVPGVPVVIMTGQGSIEVAVSAFKLGAVDFVTKPFDQNKLRMTIDGLLVARSDRLDPTVSALVGESPRFRETMALAVKFARPEINILLEGETGTGKELFASAIHAASKRREGPFVPVDCSILSESLIESELFGHVKGSFTGALSDHTGYFQRADGGTLFLDEIGNLPLAFQAKILRVLQERTVVRVGGRETIKIDIRVISATNVSLRDAGRAGTFRMDLYFRLGEMTISLPPLRERTGDIERLALHFTRRYAAQFGLPAQGLSPRALELLCAHSWPGNVRELEGLIKSAVVNAGDRKRIEAEDLSREIVEGRSPSTPAASHPVVLSPMPPAPESSSDITVTINLGHDDETIDLKALAQSVTEQAERAVLARILQKGRYSYVDLARLMNIDVKTLRAKLRKYGLDFGT